ncbi:unnamed protein product, partial [Pocillopora meandrina]
LLLQFESFAINEKHVLTEYEEKDWNGSSSKAVNEPVNEVDPTKNLTFNRTLTNNEHQVNPVCEGKVFYQPDEADDFDEDDPDED